MDMFADTLLNNAENIIPKEYDWYAPLIGDWDFDYYDDLKNEKPRHVVGEWIFRKILEGSIVQDIFICPSRTERTAAPQKDGEYGSALRKFNFEEKCYDMVYCTKDYMIHVKWQKESDKLVGTVQEAPDNRFIFSDITKDSFSWANIQIKDNGITKVISKIYAKRKKC
ncbi:MAG: hypothetical protein ACI4XF_01540 [Oscillospiraceae bacterium]